MGEVSNLGPSDVKAKEVVVPLVMGLGVSPDIAMRRGQERNAT